MGRGQALRERNEPRRQLVVLRQASRRVTRSVPTVDTHTRSVSARNIYPLTRSFARPPDQCVVRISRCERALSPLRSRLPRARIRSRLCHKCVALLTVVVAAVQAPSSRVLPSVRASPTPVRGAIPPRICIVHGDKKLDYSVGREKTSSPREREGERSLVVFSRSCDECTGIDDER